MAQTGALTDIAAIAQGFRTSAQAILQAIQREKRIARVSTIQKKGVSDSFRYPQGIKMEASRIFLPKIGLVRYRNSRPIEGVVKQVTIKRNGRHWFVVIVCEIEHVANLVDINPEKAVGIDVGLSNFAYLSDGSVVGNPRFLRQSLKRLAQAQRSLARKQRGSNNRKKQLDRVTKKHAKIKNQRADFLHKESTTIVKNHDVVAVEDLNIKGMIKNRHLSLSIADASWGQFTEYLKYKCSWIGKHFIAINRFESTSKKYSNCSAQQVIPLHVRVYNCSTCGMCLDRDWNASINIRAAGLVALVSP